MSGGLLTFLRWLDTVFQGQCLPSLSINYVAINKCLKKLPPQLYQIKMKICHDQGCKDIGVVIAMESHHYLFCLQHWGLFFQNRSWKLFPPIATSMFVKFEWNVALTLLPYNMKIILRLKGLLKQRLISGISIFQKNLSSGLKIIC